MAAISLWRVCGRWEGLERGSELSDPAFGDNCRASSLDPELAFAQVFEQLCKVAAVAEARLTLNM